jgi:hypothetical protein
LWSFRDLGVVEAGFGGNGAARDKYVGEGSPVTELALTKVHRIIPVSARAES